MSMKYAFETFPQIETKNLLLRQLYPTDANELFKILGDDKVTEYYDDDTFTNIEQANKQINAWENGYKNRGCIRWGITQKDEGKVIGTCGYYGFHFWNKRASFGYELGSDYWRQGIMTQAIRAMINFGFDEMELNRVQALVMPKNVASIRMLEKLGFEREGRLEEYERWGSKGFVDLFIFALLRKAWSRSEK
jgi:ribosomal-protein-alanine N-acetyltransferase